jgi:hypothetical protein
LIITKEKKIDIEIYKNKGVDIETKIDNNEKQFYRRKIKMKKLMKKYYLNVLLKLNDNEKSHYNLWKNKQKKNENNI